MTPDRRGAPGAGPGRGSLPRGAIERLRERNRELEVGPGRGSLPRGALDDA